MQELQKRLGRKTVGEDLLAGTPVVFIAYDLLYESGEVLIDEPLATRSGTTGAADYGDRFYDRAPSLALCVCRASPRLMKNLKRRACAATKD
ncbi:MAG: hypothetical protein WKF84_29310 [Pyrinomonadaceae bacterium]